MGCVKVVTDIGPVAEFPKEEYDRIVRETRAATARGPQVLSASFDAGTGMVSFSMKGGAVIIYPARDLPGLDGATDMQLADVKPVAQGTAVHWDSADVHYSTPVLLQVIFKLTVAAVAGAKGGRPRKKAVAE